MAAKEVVRERDVAADLDTVWARLDDAAQRVAWLAADLPADPTVTERSRPRRLVWGREGAEVLVAELVPVAADRTRVRLTCRGAGERLAKGRRRRELADALEDSLRALDAQLRVTG